MRIFRIFLLVFALFVGARSFLSVISKTGENREFMAQGVSPDRQVPAAGEAYPSIRIAGAKAPVAGITERGLVEALKKGFPPGKIQGGDQMSDGSRSTTELTEDGGTIVRIYTTNGKLSGENWQLQDGRTLVRSFSPSGALAAATLEHEDGAAIIFHFGESGETLERKTIAIDGSSVKTVFDASGKVIGRWQATRDGRVFQAE